MKEGPRSFLFKRRERAPGVSHIAKEGSYSFLYIWRGSDPEVLSTNGEGETLELPPRMTGKGPWNFL